MKWDYSLQMKGEKDLIIYFEDALFCGYIQWAIKWHSANMVISFDAHFVHQRSGRHIQFEVSTAGWWLDNHNSVIE